MSEIPSYGDLLNKTLLKRWQTQQSLPRVSEHARISELNPEKHSVRKRFIEDIFEVCENNRVIVHRSFVNVCMWLQRSQNVLNDIVNEVSAVSVKRSVK